MSWAAWIAKEIGFILIRAAVQALQVFFHEDTQRPAVLEWEVGLVSGVGLEPHVRFMGGQLNPDRRAVESSGGHKCVICALQDVFKAYGAGKVYCVGGAS